MKNEQMQDEQWLDYGTWFFWGIICLALVGLFQLIEWVNRSIDPADFLRELDKVSLAASALAGLFLTIGLCAYFFRRERPTASKSSRQTLVCGEASKASSDIKVSLEDIEKEWEELIERGEWEKFFCGRYGCFYKTRSPIFGRDRRRKPQPRNYASCLDTANRSLFHLLVFLLVILLGMAMLAWEAVDRLREKYERRWTARNQSKMVSGPS